MILYSDKLYALLEKHLSLFERRKVSKEHESRNRHELVLFGYQKGGQEFLKVFKQLQKPYVVVDYDPSVIDTLDNKGVHYMYGDATDIELLEEIGLDQARLVVSSVTDYPTNSFLADYLEKYNPRAVFICRADTPAEASDLYNIGAAYVMMPHYIGSEKIGNFIRRNGLSKTEFRKFREKHLAYLQTHYEEDVSEA